MGSGQHTRHMKSRRNILLHTLNGVWPDGYWALSDMRESVVEVVSVLLTILLFCHFSSPGISTHRGLNILLNIRQYFMFPSVLVVC